MVVQVKTWGNSQGIRIPQKILKEAKIKSNDVLKIEVVDEKIVLEKKNRHRTLAERIAEAGGTLEPEPEYNWGEPVGKESLQ